MRLKGIHLNKARTDILGLFYSFDKRSSAF